MVIGLKQRKQSFDAFIKIGDKKTRSNDVLFATYSLGVSTNRDAWCYSSSIEDLKTNMASTIEFFNAETERYKSTNTRSTIRQFVKRDPKRISWTAKNIRIGSKRFPFKSSLKNA